MNKKMEHCKSGGIGFFGLLTLIFIVLKLTGHITWSWVWVLSPIWGSLLFSLMVLLIILLFLMVIKR